MTPGRHSEDCVILGVDPGTAVTGFGLVKINRRREAHLIECGVIRTSSKAMLWVRIREIFESLDELITEFSPAAMSVEDVFYGKNVKSALTLGHARGAILLAASLRDVEVAEYTPREIKKAIVGAGDASKDQVAHMVQRHLRLGSPPKPNDAADGVAAALCHGFTGRLPNGIGPRLVVS